MSKLLKSITFIFVFTLLFTISLVNKVGAQTAPDLNLSFTPSENVNASGTTILKIGDLTNGTFHYTLTATGASTTEIGGASVDFSILDENNTIANSGTLILCIDGTTTCDANTQSILETQGISYTFASTSNNYSWDIDFGATTTNQLVNNSMGDDYRISIYSEVNDGVAQTWYISAKDDESESYYEIVPDVKMHFFPEDTGEYANIAGFFSEKDLVNGYIQLNISLTGEDVNNLDELVIVVTPTSLGGQYFAVPLVKNNDAQNGAFSTDSEDVSTVDNLKTLGVTAVYNSNNSWTIDLGETISNNGLTQGAEIIIIPQAGYRFTNNSIYYIPNYPVKFLTYTYFDLEITPEVNIENINSPVNISLDKNDTLKMNIKRIGPGKNLLENILLAFNVNNAENIQKDNNNDTIIADYNLTLTTTLNPEDSAIDNIVNNVSSSTDTGITATFIDDTWTVDFGEEITKKLLNNNFNDRDIDFIIFLGNQFYPMNNSAMSQFMALNPDPYAEIINLKPYTFNYYIYLKTDTTKTSQPSGVLFSTTAGPSRPTVTEADDSKQTVNWQTISTSTVTSTTTKETATSSATTTTTNNENSNISNPTATNSTSNQASIINPTFTQNLNYHSNNLDTKNLQKFLNLQGFPVSTTGAGSLNNETNYNGPLTRMAIKKFQEAHPEILINAGITTGIGTGYFGPHTRAYINNLLVENPKMLEELNGTE